MSAILWQKPSVSSNLITYAPIIASVGMLLKPKE